MSRENVEVMQRVHEAVQRGDRDTVLDGYSPDTEWDDRDLETLRA